MSKLPYSRPHPFVLVGSEHGSMIVNRLDAHQLPTGATYGVGHQILSNGFYDLAEIDFVKDVVRRCRSRNGVGVVALDCGANIGVHTLELAQEMTGWGETISFEAQERIYYALCGNIALNNVFNARAVFAALGSTTGTIEVPRPNYAKSASFGSLELKRTPKTEYIGQSISYAKKDLAEIPLIKIDDLKLPRVDFIKLDVEGMEIDVLHGAEQTIENCSPDFLIEWIKTGKEQICDFLSRFGYTFSDVGANVFATKFR